MTTSLLARDLLESKAESLDWLSHKVLVFIAWMDDYGASTVSWRQVGLFSFLVLAVIKLVLGKRRGIDWYGLFHALVTGIGAAACIYLDVVASETLTGFPEPQRSCQCLPPLTSLHRILPAISTGYSILDTYDGAKTGPAFLAHGIATGFVMVYFSEINAPHIVVSFLLMEVSTVFFNLLHAEMMSKKVKFIVQLSFAFFFFVCRILISPIVWVRLCLAMYKASLSEHSTFPYCYHSLISLVAFLLGMFFHILNAYWFYKIVMKARRTLRGDDAKTKRS